MWLSTLCITSVLVFWSTISSWFWLSQSSPLKLSVH
jgi:hypothetical protein